MKLFKIKLSLIASLRRRYLFIFKRSYVNKMLSKRQGSCDGCGGMCCIRNMNCSFFKKGKCSIYNKGIPLFCKIYPIDQKDIELGGMSDVCQFYWEDDEKTVSPNMNKTRQPKS